LKQNVTLLHVSLPPLPPRLDALPADPPVAAPPPAEPATLPPKPAFEDDPDAPPLVEAPAPPPVCPAELPPAPPAEPPIPAPAPPELSLVEPPHAVMPIERTHQTFTPRSLEMRMVSILCEESRR
jgi:hypothetical protein